MSLFCPTFCHQHHHHHHHHHVRKIWECNIEFSMPVAWNLIATDDPSFCSSFLSCIGHCLNSLVHGALKDAMTKNKHFARPRDHLVRSRDVLCYFLSRTFNYISWTDGLEWSCKARVIRVMRWIVKRMCDIIVTGFLHLASLVTQRNNVFSSNPKIQQYKKHYHHGIQILISLLADTLCLQNSKLGFTTQKDQPNSNLKKSPTKQIRKRHL